MQIGRTNGASKPASTWRSIVRGVGLAMLPGLAGAQGLPATNYAMAHEEFGRSLATGDFNGDGIGDLAVGVPQESASGVSGAGTVQVFYGQALLGPQVSHSALWHQGVPGVDGTPELNDEFGASLASGDFDRDGYDDLAIGVPLEDIGTLSNAGAVHVLFGSPNGITAAGDQLWHQNSAGIADTAEIGDHFGETLAVGDFDGDGSDDLAIGTPGEDLGGVLGAGVVQVLYGSFSSGGLTASASQLLQQGMSGIEEAPEPNDAFGAELAVGDFDGDGRSDLAIGAPGEDLTTTSGFRPGAGLVHVLRGSPTGIAGTGVQTLSALAPELPAFWPDTARFGAGLAAGDFDGDGLDDLAVGTPSGYTFTSQAGMVYVYYSLGFAGFDLDQVQALSQDTPGIGGLSERFDAFGAELVTGDFDADGIEDLAVGVPGEDIGNLGVAGAVNVIYGLRFIGLDAFGDQLLYQSLSDIEGVSQRLDRFGEALACGDLDGDGRDDLAIGVPGDRPGGVYEAGAVSVFFSSGYYGLLGIDDILLQQFVWEVLGF